MRALSLAALALAGLALLAPAAGASAERLQVQAGYPLPDVGITVWEHEACALHQLAWQGGWFTLADALAWLADDRTPTLATVLQDASPGALGAWTAGTTTSAGALDDRTDAAALALAMHAMAVGEDAARRHPSWVWDPLAAALWANDQVGQEDLCLLGSIEVTTGL